MAKNFRSVNSISTYFGANRRFVLLELLKTNCAPILFYSVDTIYIVVKIREANSE